MTNVLNRKRLILCCLILFISFVLPMNVSAATKTLSVPRVTQAKTKWCWAAASEMVGKYGVSTTRNQWGVVELIWGSAYPNLGGSVNNMVSGVEYVSEYTKDASSVSYLLSLSTIQSKIDQGKPMIGRLKWDEARGHAIVFSGYNGSNIRCIDPWEDTSTTYYSYDALLNGSTFLTGTGVISHTVYY